MLARDQDGLLRATLALLDDAAPNRTSSSSCWAGWCGPELVADGGRFQRAAFASGLTAALASLAARHGLDLPPGWRAYANEQVEAVAQRQGRYRTLLPEVLTTLHGAGVAALPVKGLVVADAVWPDPAWRPMSDLDVVVDPADRVRAGEALVGGGLRRWAQAAWEDTYLAWGDGSIGRTDGESPLHNGKVEVHPGWVERLHNYLLSDGGMLLGQARPDMVLGAPALTLAPAAVALQVIGHLSACVIRGEVRPLNVLDAVLCLRALPGAPSSATNPAAFPALAGQVDPRLVYPGLWLVERYQSDLVSVPAADGAGPRRLAQSPPWRVLRDPTQRRNRAWRLGFTASWTERARVLQQWAIPPAGERGPDGTAGLWRSQAARVARAVHLGNGRP